MGGTSATVTLNGQEVSCPVRSGSVGPDVIDIRKLYAQTGAFTFDPGFTSTASCDSAITYIDGDEGVLLHRGSRSGNWPNIRASWKYPTCCSTVNCPARTNSTSSPIPFRGTPCCMNSLPHSIGVSGAMPIPWPSCAEWSAHCPHSTTTQPTSPTLTSVWWQATA